VVKITYDGLVEMLGGGEPEGLNLSLNPPTVILMAGLQGSGKTTTAGKLALRLCKFERKKVLLASLDTRRPAAMEQLAMLASRPASSTSCPSSPARRPVRTSPSAPCSRPRSCRATTS
jgi:signal recognition particle subunit SRP54